jgi:hypothetical protein
MQEFPKILDCAVSEIEEGASLECYAAADAARLLVENWKCAISDEESLSNLLPDVDRVISQLNRFKAIITNKMA